MKYFVRHSTRYLYSDSASISHNRLYSRPRTCDWQKSSRAKLVIDPEPAFIHHHEDFYNNPVSIFTVQSPHQELKVEVSFEAEVLPRGPLEKDWNWDEIAEVLRQSDSSDALVASQFRFDSPWVQRHSDITEYARSSFKKSRSLLEGCEDFCGRVFEEFEFDGSATDLATPLVEVFEKRKGVCQDFAHLTVAGLRGLGLAARYVSGYIRTIAPPGQEKLQGADASHAWISVWTPSGWVDFDPTNNCRANTDHVTLAWGRDYQDVCPLRGVVLGGGTSTVEVGVDVVPQD